MICFIIHRFVDLSEQNASFLKSKLDTVLLFLLEDNYRLPLKCLGIVCVLFLILTNYTFQINVFLLNDSL